MSNSIIIIIIICALRQVHTLVQSEISPDCELALPFFSFQILLFFFNVLLLLPRLPATSTVPFIFSSTRCFRRQLLRKTWPITLTFLLFTVCRILLSVLTLPVLLHFSHDRSNSSSPPFSSNIFQNCPGTSDVLSEVSKFQHHTKLLEIDKNNLLRRQTLGALFVSQHLQTQQTQVKYVLAYFY